MSSDRQTSVMFHTQRGKWGMASFTSTRAIAKLPDQKNSYPKQPASTSAYAYENPDEANAVPSIAAAATTPKPRKFFKSRTSASTAAVQEQMPTDQPQPPVAQPQESYADSQAEEAPKPKTKHSKKKAAAIQEFYVQSPPQPVPQPEPALFIPQPSVSQDRIRETIPSKRYLARTRKVQVNYNEDETSQQPAPVAPTTTQPPPPTMTVPLSAVSPSLEHPPIVLRISKGTSRLVSTDSEEANNASPPHQAFTSPSSSSCVTQSPSNVVVVAKEKQNTFVQSPPPTPISNRTATRKRRSAAAATTTTTSPATPETPPGQPRRTTRAIRRQQEEEELRSEQEQTACEEEEVVSDPRPRTPQPGSENYDLYRTLAASSPEEGEEKEMIPELPIVATEVAPQVQKAAPAKRGRKKKAEVAATATAPPAPPPPVVVNTVPAAVVEAVVDEKPLPVRRGRKPKATAATAAIAIVESKTKVKVEEKPVEEQMLPTSPPTHNKKQKVTEIESSPRRSTRGAAAATQVTPTKVVAEMEPRPGTTVASAAVVESSSPSPKAPIVRSYGRKRKGAAAAAATVEVSPVKEQEELTAMDVDSGGAAAVPVVASSVEADDMDDKPLVKLVISKKKGSIFKSRALASNEEVAKNRPVYKHKWDVDEEDRNNSPKGAAGGVAGTSNSGNSTAAAEKTKSTAAFDGDFEEEEDDDDDDSRTRAKPSTNFKPHRRALMANHNNTNTSSSSNSSNPLTNSVTSTAGNHSSHHHDKHAAFYTVVKQAHQIQEIGEFQEMDDDVEYILDTLQPKYPILTRCLSAMQLSTKCMTPEFRMHVRAHGTVTQFFRVLQDAPKDRSLALCTAAILFVLSQDNIGMDLDRDSLELMLNLLDCDEVAVTAVHGDGDLGLTEQQAARNKMKVRELCEEVKAQGKAPHLNLDNVTVGTLAMETLLSLTSKRAGEWFKEELRNLGGLEHIVRTICECCRQISDYVAVWTEGLLEKLRKIERCLRVLDNVMEMNEQNQQFILAYENGQAINVLVKLYKLCDTELALYPTTAGSAKDSPGVAIREALVPTLKVLISLTHSFGAERAVGARVVGEKVGVFDTSLHLLFHSGNYVPEGSVFELSILVLLLLTNLTMHTAANRRQVMEANALSDFGSQFAKVPAVKALVEFFYKCEELARLAEANADAIMDAKPQAKKSEKSASSRKGEEMEDQVTKILQTAGNHMEHTIMASYVCMLIGHLVMHDDGHREKMSAYLRPGQGFAFMAKILEKYFIFMNLTASAEALSMAHIEATKKIIDYLTQCDGK